MQVPVLFMIVLVCIIIIISSSISSLIITISSSSLDVLDISFEVVQLGCGIRITTKDEINITNRDTYYISTY